MKLTLTAALKHTVNLFLWLVLSLDCVYSYEHINCVCVWEFILHNGLDYKINGRKLCISVDNSILNCYVFFFNWQSIV